MIEVLFLLILFPSLKIFFSISYPSFFFKYIHPHGKNISKKPVSGSMVSSVWNSIAPTLQEVFVCQERELSGTQQALIKLIQCHIDLHHVEILLFDEITDNQVKLAAVAQGIARPADEILCLFQI